VDLTWHKSSFSGGGPNCVEVARPGTHVLVRDSKYPSGGYLTIPASALTHLSKFLR
jgi:Domain of unknown function (DUF397)